MNIAIIGAGGNIGQRIAAEALSRGHQVTGIQRKPEAVTNSQVKSIQGDLADPKGLAQALQGFDVVINATNPADIPSFVQNNRNFIKAVREARVPRVIFVGGASSLEIEPGKEFWETGFFEQFDWKWIPEAGLQVRNYLRNEVQDVNWTYFSPAGVIGPGERTGKFRTGTMLLTDEAGNSNISYDDYAIAMLDEIENPQFEGRKQFTAAY